MRLLPPRRWFRFRLSSVLILTAIAVWAMATPRTLSIDASRTDLIERLNFVVVLGWLSVEEPSSSPLRFRTFFVVLNPVVIGPALATFIAWKVVERRRRHPAAPEWNYGRETVPSTEWEGEWSSPD